jgi:hypothetical protein
LSDHEPESELEPADRELAERLGDERPVPAGEFRGGLGRRLAASDPGYGPRPAHLLVTVAVCLGAGTVIAVLGALVATGLL